MISLAWLARIAAQRPAALRAQPADADVARPGSADSCDVVQTFRHRPVR